jgi:hypothetical protein
MASAGEAQSQITSNNAEIASPRAEIANQHPIENVDQHE